MKKIFLIIFLGSLLFPLVSLAGTYMACEGVIDKHGNCVPDGGYIAGQYVSIYYDGLVPCGKKVCKFDPTIAGTADPCIGKRGAEYLDCQLAAGKGLEQACGEIGGTMVVGKKVGEYYTGFPCTFCHFFVMLDGIIDFVLFQLVPVIAVLMLVIAGVMYVGAIFELVPGGWETFSRAKKIFTSIIIGLVIIYAGWLVINLFFNVIEVAEWTGLRGGWFSIKCPIALPPT